MILPRHPADRPLRVLTLVPAQLNYMYEQHGRRVCEALRELGCEVELGTLARHAPGPYDWCVLANINEIVTSYGQEDSAEVSGRVTAQQEQAALDAVAALGKSAGRVSAMSIDSVGTPWYAETERRVEAAGVCDILDFGLHSQADLVLPSASSTRYRYVPNGLTAAERLAVESGPGAEDRPLPWAFVGHVTQQRAALVDRLVRELDARGFVYLPQPSKLPEKNSPHLNEVQYAAVLRRTRFQVWCSHHGHFYLEGERFRMSLLSGSVPVKVVFEPDLPADLPFGELIVSEQDVAEWIRGGDFGRLRKRFRAEFLAFPSLADGISAYLRETDIAQPCMTVAEGESDE